MERYLVSRTRNWFDYKVQTVKEIVAELKEQYNEAKANILTATKS